MTAEDLAQADALKLLADRAQALVAEVRRLTVAARPDRELANLLDLAVPADHPRAQEIDGLLRFAAMLAEHPEMPLPSWGISLSWAARSGANEEDEDEAGETIVRLAAAAMGTEVVVSRTGCFSEWQPNEKFKVRVSHMPRAAYVDAMMARAQRIVDTGDVDA